MATTEPPSSEKDADWLQRNADVVDIDGAREQDSESWERAKNQGGRADVQTVGGVGRYDVELPDGDEAHSVILVKDVGGNWVGTCDCDGWMYNDWCAHLCTLAQRDVLNDPRIPQSNELAETLLETDAPARDDDGRDVDGDQDDDSREVEVVDHVDGDDQGDVEEPVDDGEAQDAATGEPSKPVQPVEPQGSQSEDLPANGDTDPFAGEMPDVGSEYVMEMDGETYIRRAGYARLARSQDLRLRFEEVVGAHETDWTVAKYRCRVFDEDRNQIADDVGTAHVEHEDMAGAAANLDELASTRAATRALAWATGEGLTAVEEVAAEKARRER